MSTMYYIDNKNTYYLKEINEYGEFEIINEFKSKEDLIVFLAYMSTGDYSTWWNPDKKWFNYLSKLWSQNYGRRFVQNLTGNDFYYTKETKKDVIWINEEEYHESYTTIWHKYWYPYKFVDTYDIPIDVNKYKDEVKECCFDNKDKISRRISIRLYDNYNKKQKKFYSSTQWHTTYGQGTGKNCRDYYRKNSFNEYDDDGELLYKVKPKYQPAYWGWRYGSRHSSGWKDKKHRHQWEHNLCNGNKKKQRKERRDENHN